MKKIVQGTCWRAKALQGVIVAWHDEATWQFLWEILAFIMLGVLNWLDPVADRTLAIWQGAIKEVSGTEQAERPKRVPKVKKDPSPDDRVYRVSGIPGVIGTAELNMEGAHVKDLYAEIRRSLPWMRDMDFYLKLEGRVITTDWRMAGEYVSNIHWPRIRTTNAPIVVCPRVRGGMRSHGGGQYGDGVTTANTKVPPGWAPGRSYIFKHWIQDVTMWAMACDLKEEQKAPAVVLQLGGLAREVARDLNPESLQNGEVMDYHDGRGGQQRTGIEVLLRGLALRFAPLEVEVATQAVTALFQFRKRQG